MYRDRPLLFILYFCCQSFCSDRYPSPEPSSRTANTLSRGLSASALCSDGDARLKVRVELQAVGRDIPVSLPPFHHVSIFQGKIHWSISTRSANNKQLVRVRTEHVLAPLPMAPFTAWGTAERYHARESYHLVSQTRVSFSRVAHGDRVSSYYNPFDVSSFYCGLSR